MAGLNRETAMPDTPTRRRRPGHGRASPYRPSFAPLAEALCRRGVLDPGLAERFRVDLRTIHRWKARYPEFREAPLVGKAAWRGRAPGFGREDVSGGIGGAPTATH
jgi:hypothetical protein